MVLVLLPAELLLDPGPLTRSPAAVVGVALGFAISVVGPPVLERVRESS